MNFSFNGLFLKAKERIVISNLKDKHEKHVAPGSLAGYLFQPERALFWLVNSKSGAKIGIETEDDVVKQAKSDNENNVYEQDKHSISKNIPFGNHSKDLWNTLHIWLKAISSKEIDVKNAEFHLVTNKIIEDGIVKSIATAQTKEEITNCVESLRNIALGVPTGVKVYAEKVCEYDGETISMLIEKVVLCDGNANSYGDGLKEEMRSKLLIPESLPFSEIYDSLLGWVHNFAMNCWRNDKPAWLPRDTFAEYYQRIISRYKLKTFVETDHSLIPLSLVDKEAQYNELFVRQLYILALEQDNDILTDSIEDYLRCKHERTRLSIQGNITKEEMDRFDQNLFERWKIIFAEFNRKYKRGQKTCDDINDFGADMGFSILTKTLDHREPLADQPTEQYYLTRGSYHRLANNNKLQIGWHPEYKMLLGQGE
ncbi:hypothetical protein JDW19_14180 [Paenibacillus polymyxa]|uniref:ABC-three component systems C-terminal domain-containing protein n=1 Tax=Paenibacillus polymyxa TaxID=1406 RepID=A0A8I1IRR2_PAEPO|nr:MULTISPECIES: ABC-three component system protein [Paenibacillus]KAF6570465.1 hypothetical protein G9G53_19370 [Paenibacillus sp. EKM206P]KAF6587925.1 hypothetical protein G9G52_16025 [Paenibacillus sp. EKM205P]MBM0634261.1 hypothetical protein [Paenibacillus polymyxa]